MPDPADTSDKARPPGAGPPAAGDLVDVIASLLEADPNQREALLARLAAPDAELARGRLRALGALGLSLDEPASVLGLPRQLGRFTRLERVGAGGTGEVHLARDERTGDLAEIKLLRPEHLWFESAHERFRRELEALAPLAHHGVVRVLEVGEEQGVPWLALEWVGGASLELVLDRVRGVPPDTLTPADFEQAVRDAAAGRPHPEPPVPGAFPGRTYVEVVARVVLRVAEALAHTHAAGVLHRDVKPSNVLVTPSGRVLLVDFGLALPRSADRVTRAGSWLCSLPYAAPEQLDGEPRAVDRRADVYALGALLYELLTLRTPFLGGPEQQVRRRIATGDLERPRELNRRVSAAVEAVCLAAVDPDAARRPASAQEFADDLERALSGRPVRSRAPSALLRARHWVRRRPLRAAAAAGAVAVVVLIVALSVREVQVARRMARLVDAGVVVVVADVLHSESPRGGVRVHVAASAATLGGVPFCAGDGSATACPCGNHSPLGADEGCLNSLGLGGRLRAGGWASLGADTLMLEGAQMPNSSALYFPGTARQGGGLGAPFGDRLRCAGGAVVRIVTRTNAAGASRYPPAGDPPVSARGLVAAPGARTYQAWYRNAASYCTSATFNLTNGVEVTWGL